MTQTCPRALAKFKEDHRSAFVGRDRSIINLMESAFIKGWQEGQKSGRRLQDFVQDTDSERIPQNADSMKTSVDRLMRGSR